MIIRTAFALGLRSIGRVITYRFLKRLGYYRWRSAQAAPISGDLFISDHRDDKAHAPSPALIAEADLLLDGRVGLFGLDPIDVGAPPNWHANSLSGQCFSDRNSHWSSLQDFSASIGDIKTVWELSRFAWALTLTRAYLVSGDKRYFNELNRWASDWLRENPGNTGPNWMCGQETSLRLGHVLLADFLLRKERPPNNALLAFVVQHCERIELTFSYALAQDNNHATSEAFGLFLGGAWLAAQCHNASLQRQGQAWSKKGRASLERSAQRLILQDGTFSQYSTMYQRVLLDTLSMARWWGKALHQEQFSESLTSNASKATLWLHGLVDRETGNCPNMGANDGARLIPLSQSAHLDFRATVQLAATQFLGYSVYGADGEWNEPLRWLGIRMEAHRELSRENQIFSDGGFAVLRDPEDRSSVYARFPKFRFRPSQADALHLDLWVGGEAILRDGGSYSYAAGDGPWDAEYFAGVASHNTCQFDDHDQMPRISRFLFGHWLTTSSLSFDGSKESPGWSAGYRDKWGCSHNRSVSWQSNGWKISDEIDGYLERAVLRWRLSPDAVWELMEAGVVSELAELTVRCESATPKITLANGMESLRYMEKTELPVLEIELPPGRHVVSTDVRLLALQV